MGRTRSKRTAKRFAAERRFRLYGLAAVFTAFGFLVLLLSTVVGNAIPAFTYYHVALPVELTDDGLTADNADTFDYRALVRDAEAGLFPDVTGRSEARTIRGLFSTGAPVIVRNRVADNTRLDRHDPDHRRADFRRCGPVSERVWSIRHCRKASATSPTPKLPMWTTSSSAAS